IVLLRSAHRFVPPQPSPALQALSVFSYRESPSPPDFLQLELFAHRPFRSYGPFDYAVLAWNLVFAPPVSFRQGQRVPPEECVNRSEERRVGKECRYWLSSEH